MAGPSQTDAIIVGAGPVGLFASFQLGLYGFRCRLIDALDRAGGQCTALYADKPIYDVPGFARIEAAELVDRLTDQIAPFSPDLSFRQTVSSISGREDGTFCVATQGGQEFVARVVVIAVGGGAFRARQPSLEMEGPGSGRQAPADLSLDPIPADEWGLLEQDGALPVDSATFATSVPGIFAIGDACLYPGKVRLILSGFHEAALMAQAARKLLRNDGRPVPLYTSTSSTLQRRLGREA
ncbi:MAG: NAD(P)/FAD-dependent oxidoreductase [Rhizobiaceae bacterium]